MNFIRKEVLDLPAYHLDVHPGVKLNQNELPWDIPGEIKTQIIETLLKTPWNRYPLGEDLLLKKKMAKKFNLWPDNLVIANGSNVLIQALLMATSLERQVLMVEPSFTLFELEGRLFGNKVLKVPLNDDLSLPKDKFIRAIKRGIPGLIYIPNPNAPTGTAFDLETLKTIIEVARCLVVIDEAYYPFSEHSVIDWVKEKENLVVLRTFSKAYGLAGLRLGYMVADAEVALQVQKCLLPFNVNRLTLAAMMTILDHPDYYKGYVEEIISERERVFEALKKFKGIKVYPSSANYILFEVNNADHLFKELLARKVIIRRINDGERIKEGLRLTIGKPDENDSFLAALKEIANS